jgi:protein O-mannosyl-transferase
MAKSKKFVEEIKPEKPRAKWLMIGLSVLLFFLALALYFPALNQPFHHWDDQVYITSNQHVVNGLTADNFRWAFSTTYFGFYYPITWLSHMGDVQLYGLNPRGHYFTNILLHSMNAVLLFMFLLLATGRQTRSLAVAVLFALHPMNVESVAWLAERKNLLSTFFLLLAFIFYILQFRSEAGGRKRTIFISACYLFFVLGLMSKSSIVMFPILLILTDIWPLGRIKFEAAWNAAQRKILMGLFIEKAPFFLLSLISGILTIIAQEQTRAVASLAYIPFLQRIGESFLGYGFYLEKLFLPLNLCALYPHHQGVYPSYMPFVVFAVMALITFAFFRYRKTFPVMLSGWLFFIVSLLPVIGILQVGTQAYADRYVYFPYWGLFTIMAFGIDWEKAAAGGIARKALLAVFLSAAALFLFISARAQLTTWKDDEALFSNIIRVSPGANLGYFQLGAHYKRNNEREKAARFFEKSLQYSNSEIKLNPNGGMAYFRKACALAMLGRGEEAIDNFNLALKYGFNPEEVQEKMKPMQMLAASPLVREGTQYAERGMWDEAEADFRKAAEFCPDRPEVWSYLGFILDHKGDTGEAEKAFRKALEINPALDDAIYNLALLELRKNDVRAARERLLVLESMNSPFAENLRNVIPRN